jgi:NAD(P)-dependent dehydrogenase (short-subunit alcohol dehydrogenase family)
MAAPSTDMSGKTVMITGFTSGIGRAAAHALAQMGANLVLVCRDRDKGERVISEIRQRTGGDSPELLVGDLGQQRDIRRIAGDWSARAQPLHVLFNNAGVVMQKRSVTADGLETTFAFNHLGYFLLTNLLLDRLRQAGRARVVSTASDAHKFGGGAMNLDDLQSERSYGVFAAYGQSKLANILFTRELARREGAAGVTANCFHPGFVGSDFSKNNGLLANVLMTLGRPFARSPEKGAETGLYLCSSPEVEDTSGEYFCDMKPARPSAHAQDDDAAAKLWAVSGELTGL